MKSAEVLLKEIDDESLYPFDYIWYRITGIRVDGTDQPVLIGGALIGDLVAFIALISRTLNLPAESSLTVSEVAKRLHISSRTLSRLRQEGLVFHWVLEPNGRRRLGCTEEELDEFRRRNSERIEHASSFSRLSIKEKQEIVQLAMQQFDKNQTVSEVAAILATKSHRGHETIRVLLQQTQSTVQKFQQTGRLSRNDVRDIEVELRLGTSWDVISNRYHRSIGAIRKSLLRLRATRLKQMNMSHVELDVFSREDAQDVILGAKPAQQIEPPVLVLDSLEFNKNKSITPQEETSLISAMHLLKHRASLQIQSLGYAPTANILDRIETDLRWSFLLQQKLIIEAMPSALAVAVQHIGRPLHELPVNRLVALVHHVVQVVGESCAKLDPSIGQSALKTPAAMLDRTMPLLKTELKPQRAAAKYKAIEVKCPYHQVVPWTRLIPAEDLPEKARETSLDLEQIVSLRFGWLGKPRTVKEIAAEIGKSTAFVARKLRSWP
jgi:RNA polymerase primary sigma factor/RNA polymerase sigma factor